jgi:hypothetical protein
MVVESSAGLVGWGQLWCSGRLTGHLDILRLITRGFLRGRRLGSGSARISAIACRCAVAIVRGGKPRVGAGAAVGGTEAADERQSVWNEVGGERGVVHHSPDRVVGSEMTVGLLVDAIGRLGAKHHSWAALVGLELVECALELPTLRV